MLAAAADFDLVTVRVRDDRQSGTAWFDDLRLVIF